MDEHSFYEAVPWHFVPWHFAWNFMTQNGSPTELLTKKNLGYLQYEHTYICFLKRAEQKHRDDWIVEVWHLNLKLANICLKWGSNRTNILHKQWVYIQKHIRILCGMQERRGKTGNGRRTREGGGGDMYRCSRLLTGPNGSEQKEKQL